MNTNNNPRPARIGELSPEEADIYSKLDPERLPQHVAIIMDGNGRWAGKRRLKRFLGHQQGAESVQFVVETASRVNLPFLTLYAFSLENNLRRPRSEIVDATRSILNQLIAEAHQRGCSLEDMLQVDGLEAHLDEQHITGNLYTAHMPDPDLVIRTSGEQRISNFLLWEAAYAELYFTETLWPDFPRAELYSAIACYQKRERRFGLTPDQVRLRSL